jgi:hypothetical protein
LELFGLLDELFDTLGGDCVGFGKKDNLRFGGKFWFEFGELLLDGLVIIN